MNLFFLVLFLNERLVVICYNARKSFTKNYSDADDAFNNKF